MHSIENLPQKRTIIFRATKVVTMADMPAIMTATVNALKTYRGGKLAMIADLRDLAPMSPDVAEAVKQGIAMGRKNGIILCAHLTNSGIIRLQTNRLAREAAPDDPNSVDVVSLEEAWRLIEEHKAEFV